MPSACATVVLSNVSNLESVCVTSRVSPDEVVYVGDGMNDAISANNAGVDAVLIDRNNEFTESDKYKIIRNLKELFE